MKSRWIVAAVCALSCVVAADGSASAQAGGQPAPFISADTPRIQMPGDAPGRGALGIALTRDAV